MYEVCASTYVSFSWMYAWDVTDLYSLAHLYYNRTWDSMTNFVLSVFNETVYFARTSRPEKANVEAVQYEDVDGTQLEGYLALPSSPNSSPVPCVVILPYVMCLY
jgi:hypothetical protein